MELRELTAYALEKFHMNEQHKWAAFPNFSVLAHPDTGEWVVLILSQWDYDSGRQIERCDIKCGPLDPEERKRDFLFPPFRMKGNLWTGVDLEKAEDPEPVLLLLDRAVKLAGNKGGALRGRGARNLSGPWSEAVFLSFGGHEEEDPDVPARIREMHGLYERGDRSFLQKACNFYRQGKYMEDYTDDQPWSGPYRHYFPTYHDLNTPQLRGYFTWRTRIREGRYAPIAEPLACIYLYELLCGIGTGSPGESLEKMKAFERDYIDAGFGSENLRNSLRRWMFEYAVVKGQPAETVRELAGPELRRDDEALDTLRDPDGREDGEVFGSLRHFASRDPAGSPVIKKGGERGRHLFAQVWRTAVRESRRQGKDLFRSLFGGLEETPWMPLSSAVYYDPEDSLDRSMVLSSCRSYIRRQGSWTEKHYDPLNFQAAVFQGFLSETDRRLRRYLKTGGYLKDSPADAWAGEYTEQALAAEEAAEREAARPKIRIDLSGLEKIRLDAAVTRESLLTEAELEQGPAEETEPYPETEAESGSGGNADRIPGPETQEPVPAVKLPEESAERKTGTEKEQACPAGLDRPHWEILRILLEGGTAEERIREYRMMPAIAADEINEVFLDEIGDSVLECDGERVSLVEDYREDLLGILGGTESE